MTPCNPIQCPMWTVPYAPTLPTIPCRLIRCFSGKLYPSGWFVFSCCLGVINCSEVWLWLTRLSKLFDPSAKVKMLIKDPPSSIEAVKGWIDRGPAVALCPWRNPQLHSPHGEREGGGEPGDTIRNVPSRVLCAISTVLWNLNEVGEARQGCVVTNRVCKPWPGTLWVFQAFPPLHSQPRGGNCSPSIFEMGQAAEKQMFDLWDVRQLWTGSWFNLFLNTVESVEWWSRGFNLGGCLS